MIRSLQPLMDFHGSGGTRAVNSALLPPAAAPRNGRLASGGGWTDVSLAA